jgi:hypothetical protein
VDGREEDDEKIWKASEIVGECYAKELGKGITA